MERFTLKRVEGECGLTKGVHSAFFCQLETALLLALLEAGRLTERQYRDAEEKCRKRYGLGLDGAVGGGGSLCSV